MMRVSFTTQYMNMRSAVGINRGVKDVNLVKVCRVIL